MPQSSAQSINDITLNVYKEVTCGCCVGWIAHMDDNGFASKVIHPKDIYSVKEDLGILPKWQSCHTAVSPEGYLFEGHVPARYVTQFLQAPPADALGLAAPGMPMGSPGMEIGDQFTPYDVILMMKDGSSKVYASIKSKADQ
ncbi:MAG: metal-binding protein [SAR86 cluster bacterium]|uniref:Metal-binding protein n=1 Tax=SAR86 cluster bacterium TaxID=2030880 RepID=A0A2A5AZY9_9GAMM|nr:MAG: metal-binding protein [SAR86 cluster bacterium]